MKLPVIFNTEPTGEKAEVKDICPDCQKTETRIIDLSHFELMIRNDEKRWHTYANTEKRCEHCQYEHESKETRNKWQRKLTSNGFPQRHVEVVDGYSGASIAKAKAIQPTLERGGVVVLYGDRGRGKTGIATWLAWQRVMDGKKAGTFCRAMQIFLRIRAAFSKKAEETEDDIVEFLQNEPFLVIDELHERSESEWENRVLTEIMNGRYENEMPTLIIANADKEKLTASLGSSLIDRIKETGVFVKCDWPSYRKTFNTDAA